MYKTETQEKLCNLHDETTSFQDSFDTILDPIKYNTFIERGK